MDNLYYIQKIHEKELLKKKNVVSVGVGRKYKDGKPTDELCIVVGVSKKEDISMLSAIDLIPAQLQNVNTDVMSLGHIKAQSPDGIDPTNKIRPARPGCSVGHYKITAGTFGCVVYKDGVPLLLSNNHVFANSNDASIGDDIYQPGSYDGGNSGDKIAKLKAFVPIVFEGQENPPVDPPDGGNGFCPFASSIASILNSVSRLFKRKTVLVPVSVTPSATENEVDAAIAEPTDQISNSIIEIGVPNGTKEAEIDLNLRKYGRTTKFTQGTILQTNATVQVDYGGQIAVFVNQIITSPMSAGGDSGSLVLTDDNRAVGLLFAGSEEVTILNPIQKVLEKLQVTL